MNELLRERLIRLLSEPAQVTNEEMKSAYGCFLEQVRNVSQSEQSHIEIFRILSITRIELVSIELLCQYGKGEKCPEIHLPKKGNFAP
ncbi:hypothetical protein M2459_003684 [Parabacteroides sp. PF5-5]|uniref:hypothetical protein n=1 Tax=Parabacteroides sp. PF5-13 TaxID=2940638 RepID=UPI002476B363|nr:MULTISPECIES: hypothetical protein [unclassified Parabacteroides]MDH6306991.1 hypothetical protein [Parabacteroides sp. PH5-39]MDH6317877.1 hypothetical protein [Parabacteroides sp. PF5-13]MDH6321639.1 hypothetical protein [Parabacteroides sp. PH5-13]MDH6325378.1 hypothetical protein [Parabacteroides sp. PH5-8]MDH6329094.1 hypothetical protein [Parabacteroides sp. PH5-41]